MTKKTDPQDPGAVPGEKRTRRPALPLTPRAAELIRKAAEYTGRSVAAVLEDVAGGDDLLRYVEKACLGLAQAHDRERETVRNKLFGPPKTVEGEL